MYYIDNTTQTVRALAHEIASGEIAGAPVAVYVGAIYGDHIKPGTLGAWLSTNGDPVVLASYDADGSPLVSLLDEMGADAREEILAALGWGEVEDLDQAVAAFLDR